MRNFRFVNLLIALLRLGLGLFFLVTGVMKIGDLGETAQFLLRSDLLLPEWACMPIACIGVAMELVVGICMLLRWHYRGAALWGVVMSAVYLFLYAQAWARGLELSCNCLGSSHDIVDFPLDTGMRLLLLGTMLLIVWDSRRISAYSFATHHRSLDISEL